MRQGGGTERIEKEHAKGKWTARERLDRLFDSGSERLEIGALAGHGMYENEGGCPAGGVVIELGRIHGQPCLVVANDATVKAGAWFPITGKKNLQPKRLPSKIAFPSFTWLTVRVCTCQCRTRSFPTRNTLDGCSETTPVSPQLGFLRLPP